MARNPRLPRNAVLLDEHIRFTLVELCAACRISADDALEVVAEGILDPEGADPAQWRFGAADLRRLQTALRLQRDLRVNLPGAALALQLMEELEALRGQLVRAAPFDPYLKPKEAGSL